MINNQGAYRLTPSETNLMTILWDIGEPLSQQQLLAIAEDRDLLTWASRSTFSLINSLIAKEMIKEVGFVRSGKTYARTFSTAISRPRYYANLVFDSLPENELSEFGKELNSLASIL